MSEKIEKRSKLIAEENGLKIFMNYKKPKTSEGKERIWISIRQDKNKKWRQQSVLGYSKSADICFVNDKS
jgi:hypothetical protein